MSVIGELLGFELEAPELTDRQIAQQAALDELFERAIAEQVELTPIVLASMGLVEPSDGSPIRNMTSEEFYTSLDPIGQREFENINTTFDRIEAAQSGEKSEFLKHEDERVLEQIAENRARQGGIITGDELATATGKTTADIQTLGEHQKISAIRGDEERRAYETGLQQVNQGNIGLFRNTLNNATVRSSAFPNRSSATLSGILDAQQPSQFQQSMDFQADAFGASNKSILSGAVTAGILQKLFS